MKYLHTGLEKAAELRRKEEVEHVLLLQTPWAPIFFVVGAHCLSAGRT